MKSVKSETSTVVTSACTVTKKFECLIPCERYSSLNKLIHITAYVLKFVRILKVDCVETKLNHQLNY